MGDERDSIQTTDAFAEDSCGTSVPINGPEPTRFVLHKLMVAQIRRHADARSAARLRKNVQQAGALIEALARQWPGSLRDAWEKLASCGASWREKAPKASSSFRQGQARERRGNRIKAPVPPSPPWD
ncbi:GSU2403 family nucleotidyltransferase fold protein [Chenggangzhangella methanolivorans]